MYITKYYQINEIYHMKCLFQNFVFFYACIFQFEYFDFNCNNTKKFQKMANKFRKLS